MYKFNYILLAFLVLRMDACDILAHHFLALEEGARAPFIRALAAGAFGDFPDLFDRTFAATTDELGTPLERGDFLHLLLFSLLPPPSSGTEVERLHRFVNACPVEGQNFEFFSPRRLEVVACGGRLRDLGRHKEPYFLLAASLITMHGNATTLAAQVCAAPGRECLLGSLICRLLTLAQAGYSDAGVDLKVGELGAAMRFYDILNRWPPLPELSPT